MNLLKIQVTDRPLGDITVTTELLQTVATDNNSHSLSTNTMYYQCYCYYSVAPPPLSPPPKKLTGSGRFEKTAQKSPGEHLLHLLHSSYATEQFGRLFRVAYLIVIL